MDLESVSGWLPRHLVHLLWWYHGMGHGKFRITKNLLKIRENQKGEKGRLVPKNQRHVHQFLVIICTMPVRMCRAVIEDCKTWNPLFANCSRQQDTRLSEDATCADLHYAFRCNQNERNITYNIDPGKPAAEVSQT